MANRCLSQLKLEVWCVVVVGTRVWGERGGRYLFLAIEVPTGRFLDEERRKERWEVLPVFAWDGRGRGCVSVRICHAQLKKLFRSSYRVFKQNWKEIEDVMTRERGGITTPRVFLREKRRKEERYSLGGFGWLVWLMVTLCLFVRLG